MNVQTSTVRLSMTQESQGCIHGQHDVELPHSRDNKPSEQDDSLIQSFALIQKFMLKKGLIDAPIDQNEMKQLLMEEEQQTPRKGTKSSGNTARKSILPEPRVKANAGNSIVNEMNINGNESKVTIYKRAIKQIAPEAEAQIEQIISNARAQGTIKGKNTSSSSEEFLDTSDECDVALIDTRYISGQQQQSPAGKQDHAEAGGLKDPNYSSQPTLVRQADEFIKEAERSKAKLYEVPGNVPLDELM